MKNLSTILVALLVSSATDAFSPLAPQVMSSSRFTQQQQSTSHHFLATKLSSESKEKTKTASPSTSSTSSTINTQGMPDLLSFMRPTAEPAAPPAVVEEEESDVSFGTVFSIGAAVTAAVVVAGANSLGITVDDVLHTGQAFLSNPSVAMTDLIEDIKDLGPAAPIYFGILYFLAEILAVPATPLTLSAGYLFGLTGGVATVLLAGTAAACVGFWVGKTVLRSAVEGVLEEQPTFRKLDKAIGEQGFKLLVLVRLTPLFPFALSNYIYGASAIDFTSYFWGTLLGFTPGTIGYVYTGMVGQALVSGEGTQPWYVYAGGLALLAGALKVVTDTATGIVQAMEDEGDL